MKIENKVIKKMIDQGYIFKAYANGYDKYPMNIFDYDFMIKLLKNGYEIKITNDNFIDLDKVKETNKIVR